MRKKIFFLVCLCLTVCTTIVGATAFPASHTSPKPQAVSMDGYGWTTFGPEGHTWMCAYTESGNCVPVAGGGGMARVD